MPLPFPFFKKLAGLAMLIVLLAPAAPAQVLDPTFQPTELRRDSGTGTFATRAMAVQADSKVVVSGAYAYLDGTITSSVRRLLPDGSPDPSFLMTPGSGPDIDYANALVVQPDGKILAAGSFAHYNAVPTGSLVRLLPDGRVDTTFNMGGTGFFSGAVTGGEIRCLALQPDGKVLVGGLLYSYNGVPTNSLVRLNADGSLDPSFAIGNGGIIDFNSRGKLEAVLVQTDGRLVVGGTFTAIAGTPCRNLARLHADGSVDASFGTGTGTNGQVRSLVQQPDGKLLVGGVFTQLSGVSGSLLRLHASGSIDASFQPATLSAGGGIFHLRLRADGSLLVAGRFTTYNAGGRGGIAHLSSTGQLDTTFGVGAGSNSIVYDLADLPGGQLLVGGSFTSFHGTARTGLARLAGTGALDVNYNPVYARKGQLGGVFPLTSGKILLQGVFDSVNGTAVGGDDLALLNDDGSFYAPIIPALTGSYHPQPDGRIYVRHSSSATQATLSRLLPTGALDPSFAALPLTYGSNGSFFWTKVLPLPTGGFLFASDFTQVGGLSRQGLVRVLPNGTVDPGFTAATPWPVADFVGITLEGMQPDGKLLISWGDTTICHLVRLHPNGALDTTFGINGQVQRALPFVTTILPSGHLLLDTSYITWGGVVLPSSLERLTPDGQSDPSFVAAATGQVTVQPDGRLVVAGRVGPLNIAHIRRLNADGSLDPSFTPATVQALYFVGTGLQGIVLQPTDGKLLLYGGFVTVNGQQRVGLARLTNTLLATQPALVAAPAFDVYPNPASSTATLRLPATPAARPAQLLDALGRPVRAFTLPAHAAETTVDVAGLPAGVYVLRCGAATRKLVVE